MGRESQAPQVLKYKLKHKYKVYKSKYKDEKKPSSRSGKFSAAVLLLWELQIIIMTCFSKCWSTNSRTSPAEGEAELIRGQTCSSPWRLGHSGSSWWVMSKPIAAISRMQTTFVKKTQRQSKGGKSGRWESRVPNKCTLPCCQLLFPIR